MTILQPVKPGLSAPIVTSIPQQWSAAWFRNFITNYLQNADIRNATSDGGGISVSSTNFTQPATISLTPIAENTVLGSIEPGLNTPQALTQTQLTALVKVFSGTTSGAVPAATIQDPTLYLNATGTFTKPPVPTVQSSTGSAVWLQAEDADDAILIPGAPGAAGQTGPTGPPGFALPQFIYPEDPDEPYHPIPGVAGLTGTAGPAGLTGAPIQAYPDDPDDVTPIPGPAGQTGLQGLLGPAIVTYPDDPDDPPITPGPGAVGANPSGSIGLSAVNGTATTFMRSDGTHALSQAIVPTWTGAHTFTPSSSVTALTINAASGALAAQINGAANQSTLGIQASSTTSQSFGMVINAGTNTNDFALSVGNSAASQSFFKIRGDGAISVYGQTYEGPGTINASGLYVAGTAVSTAVGANPSGSIGLSAVNGTATTFMRSDGTHALSQAIVPTWTGAHTFTPSSSVTALTINAASGALAAQINGAANQSTLGIQASSTTSQSFGIVVNAGTNSNDFALSVGNSTSSHTFLQIKGDGTGYIAPAISGVSALTWDSSGNVSIGSSSTGGIYCNASGGTTVQNGVFQVNGSSAGTARVVLNTQATTGTQSASFTATNKPGAATQTSPVKWLPVLLDGTTYYIPAFS